MILICQFSWWVFHSLTACCSLFMYRSMCVCVFVPCPSSVSSGRTGCRSLWPVALPVSDWSSKRSSFAWQDLAVFRPKKKKQHTHLPSQKTLLHVHHSKLKVSFIYMSLTTEEGSGWDHGEGITLMFCASTLALASSSRLMTVVLPASTAQCSAVFLWYLSPRLTETLKVSSSRVGSTLSYRGIISVNRRHCDIRVYPTIIRLRCSTLAVWGTT